MGRIDAILGKAASAGRVTVEELAIEFKVSTHTIRRDLNALCEQAKLRRVHGGAEYIDAQANLPYGDRKVLHIREKQTIARAVARLVPDGATLFFSIGTTPALVAAALAEHCELTVITNNLNVAMALSSEESNRVIIPGGELRLPDRDLMAQGALDFFSAYRADFGIYGVGGIDTDGSLLDFHEQEVRIRECIRANARYSILVADRSKFGRRAAAVGGWIGDADRIVIDRRPTEPVYADLLAPLEDRLTVAEEAP